MAAVVFSPDRAARRSRRRTGLVLGAGGVLGAAWMTGALACLQDRLPCAAGDVDVIVGTSAGSVLEARRAALPRSGGGDDRLAARAGHRDLEGVRRARRAGWPAAAAAALAVRLGPAGAGDPAHAAPGASVGGRVRLAAAGPGPARRAAVAGQRAASAPSSAGRPRRAAAALGRRPHLGRRHGLQHGKTGAVRAGGRPPRVAARGRGRLLLHSGLVRAAIIGGHRYVDGGVRSATSLDVLRGTQVQDVYVLAPTASTEPDYPLLPYLWWGSAATAGDHLWPAPAGAGAVRAGKARDRADAWPEGPGRDGDQPDGPPAQGGRAGPVSAYFGRCAPQEPGQVSPEPGIWARAAQDSPLSPRGLDETVTPGGPADLARPRCRGMTLSRESEPGCGLARGSVSV